MDGKSEQTCEHKRVCMRVVFGGGKYTLTPTPDTD